MKRAGQTVMLDFLIITVASVMYAFGVSAFINLSGVIAGGVTGISTLLSRGTNLPFGVFYGIINVPLIILSFIKLRPLSSFKTLWSVAVVTLCSDFVPFPSYKIDTILATVFGGVLLGVSTGLVYGREGTTGGFDILSKLVNRRRPDVSVGTVAVCLNAALVITAMTIESHGFDFSASAVEVGLYSLIYFFVNGRCTDLVLYGGRAGKMLLIFSERYYEISNAIVELERGVTLLDATGAYSGRHSKAVMCVVQKNRYAKVKNTVLNIDPTAFIVVSDASEVAGKGFTLPKSRIKSTNVIGESDVGTQ